MQAILRKLLTEVLPDGDSISFEKIHAMANVNDLNDAELQVLQHLGQTLRPFTFPGAQVPNACARISFIVLANSALRAAGYHDFMQELCPYVAPYSQHALDLNPGAIYEVFCRQNGGVLNVKLSGRGYITSHMEARDKANAMISAFFDTEKIQNTCKRHGLRFDNLIIVKDGIAMVTGTVNRPRAAHTAHTARQTKVQQHLLTGTKPHAAVENTATENIDDDISRLEACIAGEKAEIDNLKEEVKETSKKIESCQVEKSMLHAEMKKEVSKCLQQMRKERQSLRLRLSIMKRDQADNMSKVYRLKKLKEDPARMPTDKRKQVEKDKARKRSAMSARPACEDVAEKIDLKEISSIDSSKKFTFAGTDYGIHTMA